MQKRTLSVAAGLVLLVLLAGCNGVGPGPSSPAALTVEPGSLDFGSELTELSLLIGNVGGETLEWSVEAAEEASWLSVSPTEGVDGATVTVSVDRSGLAAGEYSAALEVVSNGGSETVTVHMRVAAEGDESPGALPGQVVNLDVRGVTAPAELMASALNPSSRAAALRAALDAADATFAAAGFSADFGAAPSGSVSPSALPAGVEAAFVLSWDPTPGATGYRLYERVGGSYELAAEVSVGELENPGNPTYVFDGDYRAGDEATFRVQAVNAAGVGAPSEADTGVIIGPQSLLSPGDGSGASANPIFFWRRHEDATGYIVTVSQGEAADHVWQQVVDDGGVTEAAYPGDASGAAPRLEAGEYLWYVVTHGPVLEGKAAAYAFSPHWTFEVD